MAPDGVDVALLGHALGRDGALVGGDVDGVEKDLLQVRLAVAAQDADGVVDVAAVDGVAPLQQAIELAHDLPRQFRFGLVALNLHLGAVHPKLDAQCPLRDLQVLVLVAQKLPEQPRIVERQMGHRQHVLAARLTHGQEILDTISRARRNASSVFCGCLPPAWAKSARPPPPPPTVGATCLMMSPA